MESGKFHDVPREVERYISGIELPENLLKSGGVIYMTIEDMSHIVTALGSQRMSDTSKKIIRMLSDRIKSIKIDNRLLLSNPRNRDVAHSNGKKGQNDG